MTKSPRPLVSVIVAGFNSSKHLRTTLNSIKNQTLDRIEIICVDDCSKDDSYEIMQEFARNDSRFHAFQLKSWSGVSAARNFGIDQARADYIMFCDADDLYQPEMCEHLYNAITTSKADLAVCEIAVTYHAHHEMKPSDDYYYGLKFHGLQPVTPNLISLTDVAMVNKIFRRQLIDQHHIRCPEGLLYEDAFFTTAYFTISQHVYYLNERLYNYIRHAKSIMSDTYSFSQSSSQAMDHLDIAFRIFDFLEREHLLKEYNQFFWEFFASSERLAITYVQDKATRRLIKSRSAAFIDQHRKLYDKAEISTRLAVEAFNSRRLNIDRLKRLALKFLPSFRRSVNNVLQLRLAESRSRYLIDEINSQLAEEFFKK